MRHLQLWRSDRFGGVLAFNTSSTILAAAVASASSTALIEHSAGLAKVH